jgi:SAM-dependent methyltransferase
MTETSATISAYDRIAADYAACWAGASDPMVAARTRFAARLDRGARVLDVGCGPGRDLAALRAQGLQASGFDRSRGMLAQARQRGALPLALGDIRPLPVRAGALNGLWCCAALLHIPKRESRAVLAEFGRALCPGGVLYVSVKQGQGERWHNDVDGQRRYFEFYEPAEIDELLISGGFAIVEQWADADSRRRPDAWLSRIATRAD